MVELDLTSDSCAVLVWASPEDEEIFGGAICGASFDSGAAMLGFPWDDSLTDAENDAYFDAVFDAVRAELAEYGINWTEI